MPCHSLFWETSWDPLLQQHISIKVVLNFFRSRLPGENPPNPSPPCMVQSSHHNLWHQYNLGHNCGARKPPLAHGQSVLLYIGHSCPFTTTVTVHVQSLSNLIHLCINFAHCKPLSSLSCKPFQQLGPFDFVHSLFCKTSRYTYTKMYIRKYVNNSCMTYYSCEIKTE